MVYPHTYRTEHSETVTTSSSYGEYYRQHEERKIPIQPELLKILQFVDSNRKPFVDNLAEAVKIKSISGQVKYRNEVIKMIKFVENWLRKLSIKYECFNVGYHTLDDGKEYRIPPVILGSLGIDPKKKTVCMYGYLDVLPEGEGWSTDPWTLTEIDKCLYGRGVAEQKGAVMSWLHLVLAFQSRGVEIPVNLKFCLESQRFQSSNGLGEFLATRKQDFFYNVDYIVACESEWLGEKYPCIIYGSVGILHFRLTVEKKKDSKTDIKEELEKICKTMTDGEENITIPNFNNYVEQITPDEESTYEAIQEFDPDEIRNSLPPYRRDWDKVNLLMHYWRLPSIYLDEIEECKCENPDTSKVARHVIIKIVPRQLVTNSLDLVMEHIKKQKEELGIENTVTCEVLKGSRPWCEDFRSPSYEAARKATIQIYKESPSMIREDRDRNIFSMMHMVLEKNILFLPLYKKGTNARKADERISIRNYFEGTKLLAAYLFQVAKT